MQFGVSLPGAGPNATIDNITRVAQWAEELGFHSLWVTDHVVLPPQVESWYPYASDNRWRAPANHNWLDPLLTLSWAGSVAPSCKLGTAVYVAPMRNPILLAKQLSTLDYITDGRVMFGMGVGWMEEEFKLIGAPFADRTARSVEMVKLMREFWSGEMVNFQGKFWQVADCQMYPLPVRRTIPIYWGGHSDAALRRVARVGDGWLPLGLTLDELRAGAQQIRGYCERYERDPDTISVVVRPGRKYRLEADWLEEHEGLGVTHWIVDDLTQDPTFNALREEMERVASICNLQKRSR